jgi:general secretion pathway protein M
MRGFRERLRPAGIAGEAQQGRLLLKPRSAAAPGSRSMSAAAAQGRGWRTALPRWPGWARRGRSSRRASGASWAPRRCCWRVLPVVGRGAAAWQTLRTAPARLDALEAQTQAMRQQAAEVRELRQSPPPSPAQAAAALKAAQRQARCGGTPDGAGRARDADGRRRGAHALRDWLTEARSGARARPIEAQLARTEAGFSGSITVALPAPP